MKTRSIFLFGSLITLAASSPLVADDDGFAGSVAPATPVEFRGADAPVFDSPEYGTAARTGLVVGAANFSTRTSATTWATGNGSNRYLTSGGVLDYNPTFPNGSQVERIEIEACDTSATDQVQLTFGPCASASGSCDAAGTVSTGVAATPGCGFFATTLAAPIVVDNPTTYFLAGVGMGTTSTTTISAVRIFYRLRVSPAPAVATFAGDVPTDHVFFRYIEALAAAGITGGCGPGLYCPNSPVTRGQMAVFLSIALGLHFPN